MPKKRFSDEQIAFALRQAEAGTTGGEQDRANNIAFEPFECHTEARQALLSEAEKLHENRARTEV